MKLLSTVALDSRVLAVAVKGDVNDWSAYIGAVPGINHQREQHEVMRDGNKLPYEVAKVLFPDISKNYIWRDKMLLGTSSHGNFIIWLTEERNKNDRAELIFTPEQAKKIKEYLNNNFD